MAVGINTLKIRDLVLAMLGSGHLMDGVAVDAVLAGLFELVDQLGPEFFFMFLGRISEEGGHAIDTENAQDQCAADGCKIFGVHPQAEEVKSDTGSRDTHTEGKDAEALLLSGRF